MMEFLAVFVCVQWLLIAFAFGFALGVRRVRAGYQPPPEALWQMRGPPPNKGSAGRKA